jgi:two-component system sensor histidine kinase VanS
LKQAWDENADPFTNAVRITVSALRKRLGEPAIIATVAGSGYRIDTLREGGTVDRASGLSVRLKLTLSYAGFVMLAGALLLAAAWVFLTRATHVGLIIVPNYQYAVLREFAPTAAIALAFLLVFGLVGGWLLAGRMLAPLDRIADATRIAANGSLSHRIRLPGRRDEFRELADAFDTMLAQLEAHVAEQQRFAANASHELRTPLAVTQTLLDVARKDPNRDNGELVDRLHAVNTRAIDLTEALLLLSRADQRTFTREHVDLSLIAEEATETLLPLAEERGLTIEISGDATPTIGSHALLLQMTTNLVHNAIVHNMPELGTVWVTASAHPKYTELTVESTGDKLTPQLVSTLAEPFQRGSRRIRTDHAGVGLGLAIVKSITQAHDGTLILTPRSAGGLRVTVQLPAARPDSGR